MTTQQFKFNYVLSSTRVKSENAFGILTQLYKVYDQPLNMDQNMIKSTILATIALHNFRRKTNENDFEEEIFTTNSIETSNDYQNFSQEENDGRTVRDYLKNYVSNHY